MLVPESVAISVRGRTVVYMAEIPDLDEKFSLYPMEGEEVIRHLLEDHDTPADDDTEAPEGDAT